MVVVAKIPLRAESPVAQPLLERHLVELVRALPRHRDQFLEPSRLPAAEAQHFLTQLLPQAPQATLLAAFDRLLHALAENQHHLFYAPGILAFVQQHAGARLVQLAQEVARPRDFAALASSCRKLRRLVQLELPAAVHDRAASLFDQGQRALAMGPEPLPVHADKFQASQLSQLLQLSPLSRVRHSFRTGRFGPSAEQIASFSFVSGASQVPVRGIAGRSEERRGRLSKIRPLLLENNEEMVDKVVKVEVERGAAAERMPAAVYQRQLEAMQLAGSKLLPRASFYDSKGDLHDIVPRYDGDLIHLMQVNDNQLAQAGLVVQASQEVLQRLSRLHAAGWGHFDVKPDNILWKRSGDFALTDYDTAQPVHLGLQADMFGSEGFTAPEILLGQKAPTAAADLFSLGITLAKLLAPQELQRVPLWVTEPHADFRGPGPWAELGEGDEPDAEMRAFMVQQLQEVVADYAAYQAGRDGPYGTPQLAQVAEPYEALRAALTSTSDAWMAALVVDRLLNPQPEQRGTAEGLLSELAQQYPKDHAIFSGGQAVLQTSSELCPYTLRMDATYRDMRLFRDGLVRQGIPPPLPASLAAKDTP